MNKGVHRNFDIAAAGWDEKPQRRMIAEAVTAGIIASIGLHRQQQVLEYGCGTGLCGLRLASEIGHLTAVDTSAGMLEELRKKSLALGLKNVTPIQISPDFWTLPSSTFDLVFSSMVLHHVEDVQTLLQNLQHVLKPGGFLAIADLESEDGSFHDDPTGVAHFGFSSHTLVTELEQLGFSVLDSQTVHTIHKLRDDKQHSYPVFLIIGQKSD